MSRINNMYFTYITYVSHRFGIYLKYVYVAYRTFRRRFILLDEYMPHIFHVACIFLVSYTCISSVNRYFKFAKGREVFLCWVCSFWGPNEILTFVNTGSRRRRRHLGKQWDNYRFFQHISFPLHFRTKILVYKVVENKICQTFCMKQFFYSNYLQVMIEESRAFF